MFFHYFFPVACFSFSFYVIASLISFIFFFFFFNDTATTEIYTLSLHDALPISPPEIARLEVEGVGVHFGGVGLDERSEEHTSELQSRLHLVCRLLLEKKKKKKKIQK